MIVPEPTEKYVVSFNCQLGSIKVGNPMLRTLDYLGNNKEKLTEEVGRDVRVSNCNRDNSDDGILVRFFKHGLDGVPVALMMPLDRIFQ